MSIWSGPVLSQPVMVYSLRAKSILPVSPAGRSTLGWVPAPCRKTFLGRGLAGRLALFLLPRASAYTGRSCPLCDVCPGLCLPLWAPTRVGRSCTVICSRSRLPLWAPTCVERPLLPCGVCRGRLCLSLWAPTRVGHPFLPLLLLRFCACSGSGSRLACFGRVVVAIRYSSAVFPAAIASHVGLSTVLCPSSDWSLTAL